MIETLTLPGVVPLGVTESQLPLLPLVVALAVNGMFPLEEVTEMGCACGRLPRDWKENESVPGETLMVGAPLTVRDTGIVICEGTPAAALITRFAVYGVLLATRPVGLIETLSPVGVVPEPGETTSQLCVVLAV